MEIVQRDYGYVINFTVKDSAGESIDLSGVTKVRLLVAEIDSHRNVMYGDCEEVDYELGTVKYTVKAEDFSKAGNYIGALELVYADKTVTTKTFFVTINKKMSP